MCEEIHCLRWIATGQIAENGCYTDKERAEARAEAANENLGWIHRLFSHHRWRVQTIKIIQGPVKE